MVNTCLLATAVLALVSPYLTMAASTPRVLVYTATAGYRHDSIPTAIQVLGQQASSYNVSFVFSEDPNMFTNQTLGGFDGVMFVSNSDEVLNATGQAALKTFFQSGGVYAGVHAASACLFNDTNYAQAVGALFDYHPTIQNATFIRQNTTHPSTVNLPDNWRFEEEVYYFRSDPRSNGASILLTVDESSYTNDGTSTGSYNMGTPHPIAWYIDSPLSSQPLLSGAPKAGRSFYTSLGHLNSTWQNATFIQHVMSGLTWALEGASTKAYGAGLVGSGSVTSSTTSGAASGTGGSSSGSVKGTGTGTAVTASTTSARSSAERVGVPGGVVGAAVGVVGGVVLGLGML